MKTDCLWRQTAIEPPPVAPGLDGSERAGVCVVGGGITGLSTALHLAREGVDVCLLEASDLGAGGSGFNVGLVNAGAWLPPDDLRERLGPEQGERLNALLGMGPGVVFDLIERHGIQCDATRTGTLHLAHARGGVADLVRRHRQLTDRGAPVELHEGDACQALVGSERFPAALLDRRAGTLNPCAYTRGLGRVAAQAGARLYTHSPAARIERDGGLWRVTTPRGDVRADRVVLATNAYTDDHWNAVRQHFFPAYFYQIVSRPLSGAVADAILPQRQGAWDTRLVLSSLRRDRDGRLILGSLGRGETKPAAWIRLWADRMGRRLFPGLDRVTWETTWTGRMAFTPDHVLRLFTPAPDILAVAGYNGRGVTTGTLIGRGFAHLLLNGDDSLLPLPIRGYAPIKAAPLRSLAYEAGFTLYHAGQCLRIVS